jgi:hypothetical protein
MDKNQLARAITELNEVIASSKKPSPSSYSAPKSVKKGLKNLSRQKGEHREKLLRLVSWLSMLSFLFLVAIISFQMWKRIGNPTYNGVSDTVINIVTGGVFGEVIAVVAVIAKEVWKD